MLALPYFPPNSVLPPTLSTGGYDQQNQPSLVVRSPSSPEAGFTIIEIVDRANQPLVHTFRIGLMTCHSDLLARQRQEAPRSLPVD